MRSGLSAIARQVEHAGMVQAVDRLGLDGMLALWQPAGAQLSRICPVSGLSSRIAGVVTIPNLAVCHVFSRRPNLI